MTSAFGRWLATLEAAGVIVLNPVPLLRGNAHKRDLLDLAAAGIRIPETVLVPRGASRGEYSAVFFNGEFSHAVLKRPRRRVPGPGEIWRNDRALVSSAPND